MQQGYYEPETGDPFPPKPTRQPTGPGLVLNALSNKNPISYIPGRCPVPRFVGTP